MEAHAKGMPDAGKWQQHKRYGDLQVDTRACQCNQFDTHQYPLDNKQCVAKFTDRDIPQCDRNNQRCADQRDTTDVGPQH